MFVSPELVLAQLAATLAFADDSAFQSRIFLYADAAAADGSTPVGAPLVEVVLGIPCGTLDGGHLVLQPADIGGAMVLVGGVPRAAQWVRGDGVLVAAGTVTDAANAGDFQVLGATTAPGDDSPTLLAGGLVRLGDVVLD